VLKFIIKYCCLFTISELIDCMWSFHSHSYSTGCEIQLSRVRKLTCTRYLHNNFVSCLFSTIAFGARILSSPCIQVVCTYELCKSWCISQWAAHVEKLFWVLSICLLVGRCKWEVRSVPCTFCSSLLTLWVPHKQWLLVHFATHHTYTHCGYV